MRATIRTAIVLLVVYLAVAMAVETGRDAGLTRKLLGGVRYCDSDHDHYSCPAHYKCVYLGHGKEYCYYDKKCYHHCEKYAYRSKGYYSKGYHSKDSHGQKYCVKYGLKCYKAKVCKYYVCKYQYGYGGYGYGVGR